MPRPRPLAFLSCAGRKAPDLSSSPGSHRCCHRRARAGCSLELGEPLGLAVHRVDANGSAPSPRLKKPAHYVVVLPGTGKSHLAQAVGFAVIQQGYRVLYREAHVLLEELADAQLAGERKLYVERVSTVPLLIIDDLGMRKLPATAAEDLLEIVMRRYERVSTLLTSNRPVEDWGKVLGDTAAVSAMLDRLLHHAHVLKSGPRSWRTKLQTDLQA